MNSSESNNALGRNNTHRAGRGDAEASFVTRRVASGGPRTAPVRKNMAAASLNAMLANKLLAALPGEDFARLLPHLEPVTLAAGEEPYRFEAGVHFAYFPEAAVISQLHVLGDGNTVEAAMIGMEGVVGLSAVFNAPQPHYLTRVLVPGTALKIGIEALRREFGRGRVLQQVLLAYAGARLAQLSQRAVCYGRHKVGGRLSCWLLLLQDRAGDDPLPLTHELMACHLGVRRAGITENANALRDAGVISYSRGLLRVLDRRRLEVAACECYQTVGRPAPRAIEGTTP